MPSSDDEEETEFVGDNEESSDDMPLSGLKTKQSPNKKRTLEDSDQESPRKRRTSRGSTVVYAEQNEGDYNDDDSDSEDDVPLAALKDSPKKKKKVATTPTSNGKKNKKKPAAAATPAKKKAKPTPTKKPTITTTTTTTSNSDDYQSASAALYGSGCNKGLLIQRLLCRWWYAINWPDPATLPKTPPKHYDALDGFPGVYIGTAGDDVGVIQDLRDNDQRPSFNTFAKKPSSELQTLLLAACDEQRKKLVEADGKGTATEKELNDIIKWATKLKHVTADKEAAKVLKAAKLTLP